MAANPLRKVARRYYPLLPLVAAMGILVSLLDSIGVSTLVPLVVMMISSGHVQDQLPGPIALVFRLAEAIPAERRFVVLGGIVLALLVLRGLVQAANNILIMFIQSRFVRDLQNQLALRLTRVDYPFFLGQDTARLIQIFTAFSWSVGDALRSVLSMIPALTGMAVIGALLAWLDWRIFLVVLACAGVIRLAVVALHRRQQALDEISTHHVKEQGSRMIALIVATRVIRIFGQEPREERKFEDVTDRVFRSSFAWYAVGSLLMPLVSAAMAGVFVLVIVFAWWLQVPAPALIAFVVLLARLEPYAAIIGQARHGISGVTGRVREVEWLLSQHAQPDGANDAVPFPALDRPIRFEAVSYAYPNGAQAVEALDFTIEPGVATALIGHSGAGKTTIVNLLCRLIEPSGGTIRIGDRCAADIDARQWRSHIAIAGQDVMLIEGTVAENIAYGRPDATLDEIIEAAQTAGAATFIAQLPDGYETPVGFEGTNLSGGQRQRIGLARALLCKPDLLILDEATNAVDAISEGEIMKLLSEHRHFRSALVISHRHSTLSACANGVVVEHGRVIESGPLVGLTYYRGMTGTAGD